MLKYMENTYQMEIEQNKICVIGCGYVGLPLAIELSKSDKNIVSGLEYIIRSHKRITKQL